MSEQIKSHRRRYVVQSVAAAGVLGLGVAGVVLSVPAEAHLTAAADDKSLSAKQAQPGGVSDHPQAEPAVEIDSAVYSRVMRIRDDIALSNPDLAALGLTEAQTEDVLTRLVEWVESNQAALIQADNAAEAARREVALLQRRIRTGAADVQEVATLSNLHRAVADAEAVCESLCADAGTHALAPAPGSVREQWGQARDHAQLPVELRHMPTLSDQRLRALLSNNTPEAAAGGGTDEAVIQSGLTLLEQDACEDIRAAIQTNLPGVAAAEARALPLPASMRDDEATIEAAMDDEELPTP